MGAYRAGRWTDAHDGEVVVFLIGMTVNRWWRPDKWWPVFTAMPRMLAELTKDPESGLLGYRLRPRRAGASVDPVLATRMSCSPTRTTPTREHRPAWRALQPAGPGAAPARWASGTRRTRFGRRARDDVWRHPSRSVWQRLRSAELPIGARTDTARQRLGAAGSPFQPG